MTPLQRGREIRRRLYEDNKDLRKELGQIKQGMKYAKMFALRTRLKKMQAERDAAAQP